MDRRVVITGMGLITPLGKTVEEYWDNLREGRSGIDRISAFDPAEFSSQIGGEIKDFDPESIAKNTPELNKLLELREALNSLKGPMSNRPEFRKKIQELIKDEAAREQLLKELKLEE